MLLKTSRHGARRSQFWSHFAAVQERPQRTGPDRSSSSQTTLTCGERTPTDLESVLATPAAVRIAQVIPLTAGRGSRLFQTHLMAHPGHLRMTVRGRVPRGTGAERPVVAEKAL
jgi:hypothetical protein